MDRKHIGKRIFAYVKSYRTFLVFGLMCAVLSVASTLLIPIFIGQIIDLFTGAGQVDFAAMGHISIYLLLTILAGALCQWLMARCMNVVTFRTVRDVREALFHQVQQLSIQGLDKKPQGDVLQRLVGDVELIGDGLLLGLTNFFTGILTIVGTIVMMFTVNVAVALLVIGLTPVSIVVASVITKRTYALQREQLQLRGEVSGYVEEHITNQQLIRSFGHEEETRRKFTLLNEKLQASGVKSQFASALVNPSARLVNAFVYGAVALFGAIRVVHGYFSLGQLTVFLTYTTQYSRPFNEIASVIAELQSAMAAARRVFLVLDEADVEDSSGGELVSVRGDIQLENVCFSYDVEKPLLQNITLHAKPEEQIALVGATGSGKTTLVQLLMRFYDMNSGVMKIDGKDVHQLTRDSVRKQFGMVLQDTWLFRGTVRENISYGNPTASLEEVKQAAKQAHAHHFIMQLPNGYDTVIGESDHLSAGQKQLLCIGRVILQNPPMLILDEATSSIDTRTELLIQQALAKVMEGRTTFIIAHRLSTIQEADEILVMDSGKIVERGKHEALLEKQGYYSKMQNLMHIAQ